MDNKSITGEQHVLFALLEQSITSYLQRPYLKTREFSKEQKLYFNQAILNSYH